MSIPYLRMLGAKTPRVFAALILIASSTAAQGSVASRQVSPAVLRKLERSFALALAQRPCEEAPAKLDGQWLRPWVGRIPQSPVPDSVISRILLSDSRTYSLEQVQLPSRLSGVSQLGLLATPLGGGEGTPLVVFLHGSGALPSQAFGLRYTGREPIADFDPPYKNVATAMAEAGFLVWAPTLSDSLGDRFPSFPWPDLDRAGAVIRAKLGGGGALTIVLANLQGALDQLVGPVGHERRKVVLVGWKEGAFIAHLAATLDPRVSAVVRLEAPLDTRVLRAGEYGLRETAAFAQLDCSLTPVALARWSAPLPLLFAPSKGDSAMRAAQAYRSNEVVRQLRGEYLKHGAAANLVVSADAAGPGELTSEILKFISSNLGASATSSTVKFDAPPEVSAVPYPRILRDIESQWRIYAAAAGDCPSPAGIAFVQDSARLAAQAVRLRADVAGALRLDMVKASGGGIVAHDTVEIGDGYVLELVTLKRAVGDIPLVGLLAIPNDMGASPRVVLSLDGNQFAGEPFGIQPFSDPEYLGAYGREFAKRGIAVFAPFIAPWFPEVAAIVGNGRFRVGPTSWSWLLAYYGKAVDIVTSDSRLSGASITLYGISYAGYAAMFLAALDSRVGQLIFSNPISTPSVLYRDADGASLAGWSAEICGLIAPVRTSLIAPRLFVWENGAQDSNGYENNPMESVEAVARVYRDLGLPDRFLFLRHEYGHRTLSALTIEAILSAP